MKLSLAHNTHTAHRPDTSRRQALRRESIPSAARRAPNLSAAHLDVEAQGCRRTYARNSIYTQVSAALVRPVKAAALATATISVVCVAVPQVGLAIWALAPAYQVGAACVCFAAAYALTFAADAVQLSVAGSLVGAALSFVLAPGPAGARLLLGAVAGSLGGRGIHWLGEHHHFLFLCGGVLASLVACERLARTRAT